MSVQTFLSKQSGLTVGLLIAILSGVAWIGANVVDGAYEQGVWRTEVKMELEAAATARLAIQVDLETMRQEMRKANADRWTRQEATNYHDMLNRLNPDTDFPPVPQAVPQAILPGK